MKSVRAHLAAGLVGIALVASGPSSSAEGPNPPIPGLLNLDRLKGVNLDRAQAAKIEGLRADLGPRLADAEAKAAPTPAQRAAREEALREAIASGKKGAEVGPILAPAFAPTDAQRLASARVGALREGFNRDVLGLLTESQKARLAAPSNRRPAYTGFLIVRLAADIAGGPDGAKDLDEVARGRHLAGLREVLDSFGLTDTRRVIRYVPDPREPDPDRRRERDRMARRLRSYWRIDVRSKEATGEILRRLRSAPGVDAAYPETALSDPVVMPCDDRYCARQGHLDPAPRGIDARFAWTRPHGDGAGIGLVDVEYTWNVNHEDLRGQRPRCLFGDAIVGDHGTGVLGEVVAADNTVGVVGVAPTPAYVHLTSWFETGSAGDRLAEAIFYGAHLMHPGDVMLVEVQCDDRSIDLVDHYYDAVRYATDSGIVVVEAAGDGGCDLDTSPDAAGKFVLNRASPDFRDSGAIVVGASDPMDSHRRAYFSCYGSRVDCFAWGRYVVTCGFGDLDAGGGDPDRTYRKAFNGTSSAAPIVAGAAMILQARIKAHAHRPATPRELRALLADPRTGTPQGAGVPGNIGIMPDLRAIIEAQDRRWHCGDAR